LERLYQYDEFNSFSHPQKNDIIDFIQFSYNKNSPLTRDYESIEERRVAAANIVCDNIIPEGSILWSLTHIDRNGLLSFDTDTRGIHVLIEDMILCYLCKLQNDNIFNVYITTQRLLWKLQRTILEDVDEKIGGDKVAKQMETITKILPTYYHLPEEIEKRRKEIFSTEKNLSDRVSEVIRKPTVSTRVK